MSKVKINKTIEKINQLKKEGKVIKGIDDKAFKAIFQDEKMRGLLALAISTVTLMDKDYVEENMAFRNAEIPKNKLSEKGKISDLIVDILGTTINLEANAGNYPGVIYKNDFYFHSLIVERLKSGMIPIDLGGVIQINFDTKELYDDRLIIKFVMMDPVKHKIENENFVKYSINLAKVKNLWYNKEELNKFEKMLLMLQLEKVSDLRKVAKGDGELMAMADKIVDLSGDSEFIGLYDEKEMNELVNKVNIQAAKKDKTIEIAKNMLVEKADIEFISKITGLSKEEIQNLK